MPVPGPEAKSARLNVRFAPATDADVRDLASKPEGYIAGWASTDDLDSYHSVIAPGAASKSIAERGLKGPKGIKLLVHHDWTKVAGVISVLEQRGDRLWIEAQLNLDISYAKDVYLAAKMNGGLSFSIGFFWETYEYDKDTDIITYTEIDLFEVSVVAFPANQAAEMTAVKSADVETFNGPCRDMAEFDRVLLATGLAKSRNDARRIALVAKANGHLFQAPAAAQEAAPDDTTPPRLADPKSDPLALALEALKRVRTALAAGGEQPAKGGQ